MRKTKEDGINQIFKIYKNKIKICKFNILFSYKTFRTFFLMNKKNVKLLTNKKQHYFS